MTTQKTKQTTKEIFVVDGNLEIYPVRVKEEDWEKGGVFGVETDKVPVPIIVCRGGWNKLTTYGGFRNKQEAQDFKDIVEAKEKGGTPEEISKRLQEMGLAKCTECDYENKARQFGLNYPKCPMCGNLNIVFA